MTAELFDPRACELGEGPLWHPVRKQFFWFDIIGKKLLSRVGGTELEWQFDEYVSAAGWINDAELLIASETCLSRFNVDTGAREQLIALEADNAITRSNDGRADPWGGFWIGTMGKSAQPSAGAIYRFYQGELVKLYPGITIPNAICFAPDRSCAYFADTVDGRIMRQKLDQDGWPAGEPTILVDLRDEQLNPDGAVVDAEGYLWNAQWGASRVARYAPSGEFDLAVSLPAQHTSCPAFGGAERSTLYVTTALEGIEEPSDAEGKVYTVDTQFTGQAEHQILL